MKNFQFSSSLAITAIIVSLVATGVLAQGELCVSTTGNYTVALDVYGGELGYYTFVECPGVMNPTIGMEYGTTYTFIQADRSNWYHPLGFAYFPDGAHAGKDELEPGTSQSGSNCVSNNTCPRPLYFEGSVFLGSEADSSDFGLDVYLPAFFRSITEWSGKGPYTIQLTFDDEAYTKDIFYFCHIHQYMTGRIKLLKNGVPVAGTDEPTVDYQYDTPGEFDGKCGTYGLDTYQLPNPECPETFVCMGNVSDPALIQYADCIDAMNCAMLAGMTTQYSASSPVALFIHQMIPHHQNAVNMAKVLLFQNVLKCDDLTNEEDPDCILEAILRDIVATQNFQIQGMKKVLELNNLANSADCLVEVSRNIESTNGNMTASTNGDNNGKDSSSSTTTPWSIIFWMLAVPLSLLLLW